MDLPPLPHILAIVIVIFFGLGLHEYAHAKFADNAGDPTPRMYGRVTLDLTKHFELVGTVMILITSFTGFGIGWGKPVPMNPSKMKNPKWDHFMAVLAGPFSNLLQATLFAVVLRVVMLSQVQLSADGFPFALLFYGVLINISLCVFNLIPLGPLDGMWLLGTFLNEKSRYAWTKWNLTSGQFVFIAIVVLGQINPDLSLLSRVVRPVSSALFQLLTGVNY